MSWYVSFFSLLFWDHFLSSLKKSSFLKLSPLDTTSLVLLVVVLCRLLVHSSYSLKILVSVSWSFSTTTTAAIILCAFVHVLSIFSFFSLKDLDPTLHSPLIILLLGKWFSKCDLWTNIISITWKLVITIFSDPRLLSPKFLDLGPRNLCF